MARKKWCDPVKRRAIEAKWITEFNKITIKKVTFRFDSKLDYDWEKATPDRVAQCLEGFLHLEYNGKIVRFSTRKAQSDCDNLFEATMKLLNVPSGQRPYLRRTRQLSTHFDSKLATMHNYLIKRCRQATRTKTYLNRLNKAIYHKNRKLHLRAMKLTMHQVANILSTQDINRLWKEVQKERVVSKVMET